jgi:hypothetical protein
VAALAAIGQLAISLRLFRRINPIWQAFLSSAI